MHCIVIKCKIYYWFVFSDREFLSTELNKFKTYIFSKHLRLAIWRADSKSLTGRRLEAPVLDYNFAVFHRAFVLEFNQYLKSILVKKMKSIKN